MDVSFSGEELRFRREVDAFVRRELPADWDERAFYWPAAYGAIAVFEAEHQAFCRDFLRKLGGRGWLTLGWPREYGGAGSMTRQAIADDVISYYRAPSGNIATAIGGPTIILVGSEEMKREFLPPIARGEINFWLGYSEPNAGSDLAALRTRAVADGDDFIVNGQKTWSSGAHVAEYAWLLVKTDPAAGGHRGATLMLVDNRSPGITIRPLENIVGFHSFNEVFFDDVRVPGRMVVGGVNRGFCNVMVALQFERLVVGIGAFRRVLDELVAHVKRAPGRGKGRVQSTPVRDALADLAIEIEVLYGLYWKNVRMIDQGRIPELEASAMKLFSTELSRKMAHVAADILGPFALLDRGSPDAPLQGRVLAGYLDAVSGPIGAGTSEIQRGIIATRGLGLPRA
jgi:alkylation response protein AidB-like acyl-CoA dehydrogenase